MDKSDILFEKYYEDVLRFLRGLSRDEQLSEELTQETIYRAIKSIHTFKGDSDMRVWLCSIAKNLFFTYCKKKEYVTYDDVHEIYEAEEKLFVQMVEDRETALQIHKILHELKEPYKEVFSLRVFGELSFKEIASLFQKSEHWACVTYHRAKMMIRQRLEN
ncbi:MAG: RNA polymerase sigma factor [Lachnospiraceae bacterium]|nr:RNA polymerase sigma factor [Lachnospiraceae bacterium]